MQSGIEIFEKFIYLEARSAKEMIYTYTYMKCDRRNKKDIFGCQTKNSEETCFGKYRHKVE